VQAELGETKGLRQAGASQTSCPNNRFIPIIEPGAWADLIVVDGDPLHDIKLLEDQGAHLPAIMKGGAFHKNQLR